MKCRCVNCETTLLIQDQQLRQLKTPIFRCPKCETYISVKPSSAKCGNCNIVFTYYDYKFEKKRNPLVKCLSCKAINRIKINY